MVTLTEQAESSALQLKARWDGLEEQLGTLEMGLSVIHVVGMFKEKSGYAKTSLDLNDG